MSYSYNLSGFYKVIFLGDLMKMVVYFKVMNRGLFLVLLGVMFRGILFWDIGKEDFCDVEEKGGRIVERVKILKIK